MREESAKWVGGELDRWQEVKDRIESLDKECSDRTQMAAIEMEAHKDAFVIEKATKGPAEYWEARHRSHNCAGYLFLLLTVGVGSFAVSYAYNSILRPAIEEGRAAKLETQAPATGTQAPATGVKAPVPADGEPDQHRFPVPAAMKVGIG